MLKSSVPAYYKSRRETLGGKDAGAAFLFAANPVFWRNSDVDYAYRQDSNFYYLTGFEEHESFLLLVPAANRAGHKTVLFVLDRDPEREMWEGERYGIDGALKVFGADEAYSHKEFSQRLPELLKGCDSLYYRMGREESVDRRVLEGLEKTRLAAGRSGKALTSIKDPTSLLGEMRLFKSKEEADLLRKAGQISAQGHVAAMEQVKPGVNESEIAALLDYVFKKSGCRREGYGSIVGGGRNATCLHYRSNNEALRDGDLLLIDAAGEYEYLTADITRTFPVGRAFSPAQSKIYDLVLKSQLEGIAMAKPGTKYHDIHKHVCAVLTEGLLSLGVLKGTKEEVLKSLEFRRYFPHGTGHWLGMDVHDVGLYYDPQGESRVIEAGMCFTIEPGLYFQPSDKDAPAEYRHIGVRIEDDILITANGCEVLTKDVPKKRDEIEALRAKAF